MQRKPNQQQRMEIADLLKSLKLQQSMKEIYQVTRHLGEGGQATVFELVHRISKQKMVCKLFTCNLNKSSLELWEFLNELNMYWKISHRCVVRLVSVVVIEKSEGVFQLGLLLTFFEGEILEKFYYKERK